MKESLRSNIVLSVNRALIGEVFPELFAISCEIYGEKKFELTFFLDSESPIFEEEISFIETEVIADFQNNFEISHKVINSRPAGLPAPDAFWVFLRKTL